MEGKVMINGAEVEKLVREWMNRNFLKAEDLHIDSVEKRPYSDDLEVMFSNNSIDDAVDIPAQKKE